VKPGKKFRRKHANKFQDAGRKELIELKAIAKVQGEVSDENDLFDKSDNDSEDEYEFYRVQEWRSSSFKSDGVGG